MCNARESGHYLCCEHKQLFTEGDAAKMCDLLDKIENKGKLEANRETAKLFLINGASLELVEKSIPGLSKDEIQEIFNSIAKKSHKVRI